MSLKIRLKPGERLAINGAVIKNDGTHAITLAVLNQSTLLHERDILLPEHVAGDPLHALYYAVQGMHIEPESYAEHYQNFLRNAVKIFAAATAEKDVAMCCLVDEVIAAVGARDMIGALRRIQEKIGKPGRLPKAA